MQQLSARARRACVRRSDEWRSGGGNKVATNLVERCVPTLTLLVRVALLCLEPGFLCRSRWFGRFALSRNYERPSDQFGESLFRQISIAALTSHVTRDDADTALSREPGPELFLKTHALLLAECARCENVPENLYPRRCLVYMLAPRARRSRDPHIQLVSRNRQRLVDREEILRRG